MPPFRMGSRVVSLRAALKSPPIKPSNLVAAVIRPDPKLTPSATFDVTLRDISEPGYSKKVRNVTAELERQVYPEYGITEHQPGEYEVDHLIPLSSEGSNSMKILAAIALRSRKRTARR
ncbi:MAG: hypothetical protein JO331_15595 [Verrucomicrobia bacterium]|nr:hypothetical protein [Verrucomicrobiota bacterium]